MKHLIAGILLFATLMGCRSESDQASTSNDSGFVALFAGEDLSGWRNVNGAPSTWTVRDGMIVCSGKPTGVLCTERHYENYVLELEWRHLHEGGNAGLFVHSDAMPARGQPFTRSTECQILDGNHGDVFAIHGATMVPDTPHPRGWMRSLPTEPRARPTGEWNHYRVESRDGRLTLAVNGKIVSGGTELNPRKGSICLDSEGSEVHFRNVRIKELPSTDPFPEEIAEPDRGFTSLYTGVDLSGWRESSSATSPWQADDWILRNEGGDRTNHLLTEESFGNFEMVADWRLDCDSIQQARAGILLRGSEMDEVLLGCPGRPDVSTLAYVPAEVDDAHNGWMRLYITLIGRRLTIEMNGEQTESTDLPQNIPSEGPIGLADHGTSAEFANLFIKRLD
ncbi:MAG TPA: DUF1080 domain-containing protein [Rhodothermales bacterium]|nr:DUF1080 domain-containing protein [Rhodothermales bacterium]